MHSNGKFQEKFCVEKFMVRYVWFWESVLVIYCSAWAGADFSDLLQRGVCIWQFFACNNLVPGLLPKVLGRTCGKFDNVLNIFTVIGKWQTKILILIHTPNSSQPASRTRNVDFTGWHMFRKKASSIFFYQVFDKFLQTSLRWKKEVRRSVVLSWTIKNLLWPHWQRMFTWSRVIGWTSEAIQQKKNCLANIKD